MLRILNSEQRKSLASFFNGLTIAWFVALFATPKIVGSIDPLTVILYFVSMILALAISLVLLEEEL